MACVVIVFLINSCPNSGQTNSERAVAQPAPPKRGTLNIKIKEMMGIIICLKRKAMTTISNQIDQNYYYLSHFFLTLKF